MILAVYLGMAATPFLLRLEWEISDVFFRLRGPIQQSRDVVFIEIADDSMESLGVFPWPRRYHAVLLDILRQWGMKYIVFDMLFTRPGSDPLDDRALAEALERSSGVYLPVLFKKTKNQAGILQSLADFQKHVEGTGHVNIEPDSDGVLRRIDPFLQDANGAKYNHLAVEAAFGFLGKPIPDPLPFPLDKNGKFILNWAGTWTQAFKHYSYADVLKSYSALRRGLKPIVDPSEMKGKICVIGVNVPGGVDIKPTPLEPLYPGMGIVGNIINSVLTGEYIRPVSLKMNLLLMFGLWGISLCSLFPFRNGLSPVMICLLLASVAGGAYWAFAFHSLLFYVARPLLMILSLFLFTLIWAKFASDKETLYFRNLAIRDGLTGLFNQRRFLDVVEATIREVKTSGEPITVIMADLDHFKEINDTYGHQAGNMILRGVAQTIQTCIRYKRQEIQNDCAARYGGEEITILLRNAETDTEGFSVAERVRQAVEAELFYWGNESVKITLSLGAAPLLPGDSASAVINRADQVLYEAKRSGRNRTCLFKNSSP